MHGGLFSKDNITLDDIRATERCRQPPEEGIMCELLWSDPQPMLGRSPSKRGVGCQFGPDVTRKFLDNNQLDYIIRSHEVLQSPFKSFLISLWFQWELRTQHEHWTAQSVFCYNLLLDFGGITFSQGERQWVWGDARWKVHHRVQVMTIYIFTVRGLAYIYLYDTWSQT